MLARVVCSMLICVFASAPLLAQGPPETSGPNVERWEMYGGDYGWWFAIIDEKRNYVAIIGVDLEAICAGEPDVWGVWDVQDVYLPPGDNLLHSVYKGEQIPTVVYPIEFLDYLTTWCDAADATDPIATGWADVIVTDNDVFAWQDEFHPRTNAYQLSAHGLLESFADGEQMMLNAGFNCQWPGYPEDPNTSSKCVQKVVLH